MWPIISGDFAVALRRNDDYLFTVQATLGLSLVLLMFLAILTLLVFILMDQGSFVRGLMLLEAAAGAYFGWGYARVTRWRVQWAEDHVVQEEVGESVVDQSLRLLSSWKRKPKAASLPVAAAASAA